MSANPGKFTYDAADMSIAIVQAGTVIYDTPATLDKLERLTKEAASHGAKLVVFPGIDRY
ncbi:hypothetical protein ANCDUO_23619 [Ancylostoma duodenale]|uniref:CN hydrolase domain-containing protein n=1 Tax=Ancylostoma duodenale TaxID=51022 RepID=A0A0C2FCR4_9BILA|nr:hypothetical protein ANCDUO_23619 [Ancylostoma duodenale]